MGLEFMSAKISKKARADFEFFSDTDLDMIGHEITGEINHDPDGLSALDCWYHRDTHGKCFPCREPELLRKVIRAKASWNLQIKLWAEDISDGVLISQSELVDYCWELPEWIFVAVLNQARKLATEKIGYAPRFTRLHTLNGTWWPPYMHDFCPVI